MKTRELTGAALDWAVAKCEGITWEQGDIDAGEYGPGFKPATDWSAGGPIIEREIADIERFSDALWEATAYTKNAQDIVQSGPTPLIAAMRCYVASKLGVEVDVPAELLSDN